MNKNFSIIDYSEKFHSGIRRIIEKVGWEEKYIIAAERNAEIFSKDKGTYGIYFAVEEDILIGFLYVQFYDWNQLVQIHGLLVDPDHQRRGIARKLVEYAENFAKDRNARGIYVDTPALNQGGRGFYEAIGYSFGYEMPKYYDDNYDGVTYQKFF